MSQISKIGIIGAGHMGSGIAKKIAEAFDGKVPIHSVRAGNITGIHEVILATDNQKITLKHESFSKEVFAEGASRTMAHG